MHQELPNQYSVEVSGWDAHGGFFLETTRLTWHQDNRKSVLLRRQLRPGAVVFVRLLDVPESPDTLPVAYRVQEARPAHRPGSFTLLLTQLGLKENAREPPVSGAACTSLDRRT